jgi:hypothetical protein
MVTVFINIITWLKIPEQQMMTIRLILLIVYHAYPCLNVLACGYTSYSFHRTIRARVCACVCAGRAEKGEIQTSDGNQTAVAETNIVMLSWVEFVSVSSNGTFVQPPTLYCRVGTLNFQ